MICSMTGYGQAEHRWNGNRVTVEVTSLNNRFFEAHVKLPRWLSHLEAGVRELINGEIKRGKVICAVTWESESSPLQRLKLNRPVAEMYSQIFRQLKEEFSIGEELTLSDLVPLEGLFVPFEEDVGSQAETVILEDVVAEALRNLRSMRLAEGERLEQDMRHRIAELISSVQRIRALSEESVQAYKERLEARIRELLNETVDLEQRIMIEAAVVAERSDVTEECVRTESHCGQFLDTLRGDGPVGKRLNFILQELNREANTIGSKSISIGISREVVSLKEEIERLREQVQNIE